MILVGFVSAAALSVGLGTVASPNRSGPEPDPTQVEPGDVDETFYVIATHWDYAIFTEDGSRLETISVTQGSTVELYATNVRAEEAIAKLPTSIIEAVQAVPRPDAEGLLASEYEHSWPVLDHGLLIDRYGVIEYLAADAVEPSHVVFSADIPGEFEFVCTNYCGIGHVQMTMRTRFVVQPEGENVTQATQEPPTEDGAALGQRIFTGDAGVVVLACVTCHQIGQDAAGPDLAGVAVRASERVDGLTAQDYLKQSILEPEAYLVEGWANVMPPFEGQLSDDQLDALVEYLMTTE